MTKQWIRNLVVPMLAGLAITGCTSSGNQLSPTNPAEEPADTDTTPPPAVQRPLSAIDADGNPYLPGTRQALTRTFYFDYDRAVIGSDDLAVLEMHASYLRDNPDRSVVVEGHCDERGTREYNLALGERRSVALRRFLTAAGVSPRQIENVSYGEERPGVAGHNESAWSRSRRAEMVYR